MAIKSYPRDAVKAILYIFQHYNYFAVFFLNFREIYSVNWKNFMILGAKFWVRMCIYYQRAKKEGSLLNKNKWERKECDGCLHYNPECRQGVCGLDPYKKKKRVSDMEKHDTS